MPLKDLVFTVALPSTLGAPTITDPLEFSLVSALTAASPVFTLTCISTGGPATTVTWTRDGVVATGATSQTVVDQVTATYTNTLTVTGRLPGVYECRVENDRGFDAEARSVTGKGCDVKKCSLTACNFYSFYWYLSDRSKKSGIKKLI